MRIEEKSDSYRQEGTASLIRFLERSRPLVKKGGKTHIHATCFLYELNGQNVTNAVESECMGSSDANLYFVIYKMFQAKTKIFRQENIYF